jgi:hypothetical protein
MPKAQGTDVCLPIIQPNIYIDKCSIHLISLARQSGQVKVEQDT